MVATHHVRVHRSEEKLEQIDQLAMKIAEVAADPVPVSEEVSEMVINRMIDNSAVALASLHRAPVIAAREQALAAGTREPGAGIVGVAQQASPEWAAFANGVAVRELDYHDTFLAAEYSHPGDNIPPVLAVAQYLAARGKTGANGAPLTGADLIRGIATGYEIQIDLAKGISLHRHKIDHVAHLGPSAAAGIGALLGLDASTIFQAVGQALHTTTATRQSRKGEISTWKAYAPAFAGKMAVEAVDRAMRGQTSPVPIYEGEDGVIAWLLDGPQAHYEVGLPERGEAKRAILDSYTKEHSAEYQAQAFIDLARSLHRNHPELLEEGAIESIVLHTSHHTHNVIGSGANDPQKYSPTSSRETLDHSIPYIFAVALQDGAWHHTDSYAPQRAGRPDTVRLWRSITTAEDPEWTRRYHSIDPQEKAFGGRAEIRLRDGGVLNQEIAVADAHPLGAKPFERADYIHKFKTLAQGVISDAEANRYLELVQRTGELTGGELSGLTVVAPTSTISETAGTKGIF